MNSPRLSDRLRREAGALALAAWRNYRNGNRKDAREILARHKGETSAMATARFLVLAHDAGEIVRRFLGRRLKFNCRTVEKGSAMMTNEQLTKILRRMIRDRFVAQALRLLAVGETPSAELLRRCGLRAKGTEVIA